MRNFVLLLILFITSQVYTQQNQEQLKSPYDTINLKFMIEGAPSPQAVGFDNAKSSWQFRYELRFVENEKKIKYMGKVTSQSDADHNKQVNKNNKEFDKVWKKLGKIVVKGKVGKIPLSVLENRELTIPINLPSEITAVLAKAGASWDIPEFRLKVAGKVSITTTDNIKFKEKFTPVWLCPTKMTNGNDTQYWLTNTCGTSIEIVRENDRLRFGLLSVIH